MLKKIKVTTKYYNLINKKKQEHFLGERGVSFHIEKLYPKTFQKENTNLTTNNHSPSSISSSDKSNKWFLPPC